MNNPFMLEAIAEAKFAAASGEVPVGAVVVRAGKVISRGRNRRETEKTALAHAELEAVHGACVARGGWRLDGCDIYVTLEPCAMCAGALFSARVRRVYFGAYDPEAGALGSLIDLSREKFPYVPEVYGGIMEEECAALLRDFFDGLRFRPGAAL